MSETVISPGSIAAVAAQRGSGVLHLNPIAIKALAEQARAPRPSWTQQITSGSALSPEVVAELRVRVESMAFAKKFWIGVALQAAAGHLTVGDVLMRAGSREPVTQESATTMLGVGLESARRRVGPAVANPLIEQAGLA